MHNVDFVTFSYLEIKRRLREQDPDLDEETLADTVEGMSTLHEVLAAIVRAAISDEALAWGLKARVREMQDRLSRLDERAAVRRGIVRDAMVETNLRKLTDPEFTISIRPGPVSVIVTDETKIPSQYWEARDPRLSKSALLNELKVGGLIPGVSLSNAEPVLSVRTK